MTRGVLILVSLLVFASGFVLGHGIRSDAPEKLSKTAQAARDDRLWIQCQDLRTEARTDLYFASADHGEYAGGPPRPVDRQEVRQALRKLRRVREQCDPIERRISGMTKWREEVTP